MGGHGVVGAGVERLARGELLPTRSRMSRRRGPRLICPKPLHHRDGHRLQVDDSADVRATSICPGSGPSAFPAPALRADRPGPSGPLGAPARGRPAPALPHEAGERHLRLPDDPRHPRPRRARPARQLPVGQWWSSPSQRDRPGMICRRVLTAFPPPHPTGCRALRGSPRGSAAPPPANRRRTFRASHPQGRRDAGFGDHPHRRYRGHVDRSAPRGALAPVARSTVSSGLIRVRWLHRYPNNQRLAGRHAALESARIVAAPLNAPPPVPARAAESRVVHRRPRLDRGG